MKKASAKIITEKRKVKIKIERKETRQFKK